MPLRTLTTSGQDGTSDQSSPLLGRALRRAHRDPRFVVQVHGPRPRRGVPGRTADDGDVHRSPAQLAQRIVAAHQLDRGTGGAFEAGHRALRPRVRQQPAEPEPDRAARAHRRDTAPQRGQDLLGVAEELPARRGGPDLPGGAVDQLHAEDLLQLRDGAAQRGLGDQQVLGGAGERAAPHHRDERPQVPQLHVHQHRTPLHLAPCPAGMQPARSAFHKEIPARLASSAP
nr:hypothetical protein [Saccharopolyspora gregorii]